MLTDLGSGAPAARLDRALGAQQLPTRTGAIVVLPVGRTSSAKTHAIGETIRLGGTPLVSVLLVAASKTDESLSVTHASACRHRSARGVGIVNQ